LGEAGPPGPPLSTPVEVNFGSFRTQGAGPAVRDPPSKLKSLRKLDIQSPIRNTCIARLRIYVRHPILDGYRRNRQLWYTAIIISLQPYFYYWYSITHSLFHSRLKSFLFCKSSLPQPFLLMCAETLTQASLILPHKTDN